MYSRDPYIAPIDYLWVVLIIARDPYSTVRARTVESAEKGKHLTRKFWPARGICIEGSETVCVFSVNFHNSEFS